MNALLLAAEGVAVGGLVHLLIVLIIIGLIFSVLWWAITQIPMPPPYATVVRVLFVLIIVLVLLSILLPMSGVTI
jgi:hypothetical protein